MEKEKKSRKRKQLINVENSTSMKRKQSKSNSVRSKGLNNESSGGKKVRDKVIPNGTSRKRKLQETSMKGKDLQVKKSKFTQLSEKSNLKQSDLTGNPNKKSKNDKSTVKKTKSLVTKEHNRKNNELSSGPNVKAKKKGSKKKKMNKTKKKTVEIHSDGSKVNNSQTLSSEKKSKAWKKKGKKKKKQKYIAGKPQSSGDTKKLTSMKRPSNSGISSNWKTLAKQLNISTVKKTKTSATKQADMKKEEEKKQSTEPSAEIWFDDVDPFLLKASAQPSLTGLKPESGFTGITKCVALDCEMVGAGIHGKDNELARVSIVNQYGMPVYDKYVKPREKVTDFRTAVSGIRPVHLKQAEDFEKVQKEVADIINGRILVGHALYNDMKVLYLSHPRRLLRDTAKYKPFKVLLKTKRPGLKKLVKTVLNVTVQEGEHNSVEDAYAAMKLYLLRRKEWDAAVRQRTGIKRKDLKKAEIRQQAEK